MSKNSTADTTAAATAGTTEAPAKRTRESRANHTAANIVIKDANTAQNYCDAVIEATRKDKHNNMYNSSGFVTPLALDGQDIDNRIRLGASVINSLAASVEEGGEDGEAAQRALELLSNYASTAGAARVEARNNRVLAEAEAIKKSRRGQHQSN